MGTRLLKKIATALGRQTRRFHRDDDAQLVFIGVFGAVAFAMFLMFMMNHAYSMQQKLRMQNAADAAVLASAEVMATGLNLVSDNNVAIAELVALKSVSEGLSLAAADIKLVVNYFGAATASTAAMYIPVVGDLFWPLKFMYGAAWNFAQIICDNEDNLEVDGKLSKALKTQIKGLQFFNSGVKNLFPVWAVFTAGKVGEQNGAAMTRVGNQFFALNSFNPTLAYPLRKGEKEYWEWPVRWGSKKEYAPASNEEGRFGFTHIYNEEAQGLDGSLYELDEGPFRRYLRESFPLQWYLPYIDPFAIVKAAVKLFGKWLKSLFSWIWGGDGFDEPDPWDLAGDLAGPIADDVNDAFEEVTEAIGGLFDSHGNDTFARHATNRLIANLKELEAPILLEPFDITYRAIGPVVVTYGGDLQPQWWRGRKKLNAPFARRIGGFEAPRIPRDGASTPYGFVACAQAQVYNPVSWDTFTQYWDYKLTRVQKIPDAWSPLGDYKYANLLMPVLDLESYKDKFTQKMGLEGAAASVQEQAQKLGDFVGMPFSFSPSVELYH